MTSPPAPSLFIAVIATAVVCTAASDRVYADTTEVEIGSAQLEFAIDHPTDVSDGQAVMNIGDNASVTAGTIEFTVGGAVEVVSGPLDVSLGDAVEVSGGELGLISPDSSGAGAGRIELTMGEPVVVTGGHIELTIGEPVVVNGGRIELEIGETVVVTGGKIELEIGEATLITGGRFDLTIGEPSIIPPPDPGPSPRDVARALEEVDALEDIDRNMTLVAGVAYQYALDYRNEPPIRGERNDRGGVHEAYGAALFLSLNGKRDWAEGSGFGTYQYGETGGYDCNEYDYAITGSARATLSGAPAYLDSGEPAGDMVFDLSLSVAGEGLTETRRSIGYSHSDERGNPVCVRIPDSRTQDAAASVVCQFSQVDLLQGGVFVADPWLAAQSDPNRKESASCLLRLAWTRLPPAKHDDPAVPSEMLQWFRDTLESGRKDDDLDTLELQR